jgi:hypothetical protein
MDKAVSAADEAQLIRSYLAGHDASCPVCAAALRGIDVPTCPACGASLRLRVGSIDLALGPWIATLIGLSLSLGLTATWCIFFVIAAVGVLVVRGPSGLRPSSWLVPLAFVGLCCLTAALATLAVRVLRRRRRFLTMTRRRQVLMAVIAIAALAPVTAFTWFLMMVIVTF